jgi:hypothetical protein
MTWPLNSVSDGPLTRWPAQLESDGGNVDKFAEDIRAEVRTRLATIQIGGTAAPAGQPSMLMALSGLDPMYLVPVLAELADALPLARRALAELIQPSATISVDRLGLPSEHPLDFDWRFDETTRTNLIRTLRAGRRGPLLLLGCPSVAADQRMTGVRATLFDDNPALTWERRSDPRMHRADLLAHPLVTDGIDAVRAVADPPFYAELMSAFLHAAAAGLRPGGHLYLILPSRWARPSAAADSAAALAVAAGLGFDLVRRRADRARYLTPKFERATHARLGLHGVPEIWRTADIAHLRLVQRTLHAAPGDQSDRHHWHETTVGTTRWRIRINPRQEQPAVLTEHLLANETGLVTVSRRDKARANANVLTDDNRAFSSEHPPVLRAVLRALAHGVDPVVATASILDRPLLPGEQSNVAAVANRIAQLP